MTDTLSADYPEAAPIIYRALEEHGAAWVLENYYTKIYPLGVIMDVPPKAELPFYDEERDDTLDDAEVTEMYTAWAAYHDNLRSASE